MAKEITYDYDEDLDILHVYSSDISQGIKGGLSYGDYTIDIGQDDKVVGVEIEEASKIFQIEPSVLKSLDKVELFVRKVGNILYIGVQVWKSQEKSAVQVTVPYNKAPVLATH